MAYDAHRIFILIPTTDGARRSPQWIDSLHSISTPLGSATGRRWKPNESIAESRNELVKEALKDPGCDYVFFIADDVLAPSNVLLTLLAKVGRSYAVDDGPDVKADMVTGIYWTKTYPPEPYIYQRNLSGPYRNWKAGEFFPVDLAGCDCLLCPTEMFRKIPEPWFSTEWAWGESDKPANVTTEDFYFFAKARKYGYRLFADTSIECLHEDRDTGVFFGLLEGMPQISDKPLKGNDEEILVADLGAGFVTPFFGSKAKVTRFDLRADVKPDFRCDIANIPDQFKESFDKVHTSHVLEHFPRAVTRKVVGHWSGLLREGGELITKVPNLDWAFQVILGGVDKFEPRELNYAWQMIYGDQQKAYDQSTHRNGFTQKKLAKLLQSIPELSNVQVQLDESGMEIQATATRNARETIDSLEGFFSDADKREQVPLTEPGDAEPAEGVYGGFGK